MLHKFEDALQNGKESPCDLKAGLRMTLPGLFSVKSALNGGMPQKIYYPWDEQWNDFLSANKTE